MVYDVVLHDKQGRHNRVGKSGNFMGAQAKRGPLRMGHSNDYFFENPL